MNNIKDLEVLSKYLSKDELKEIAKEIAKEKFRNSLGKDNPHAKSNLDFYISQGAFEVVKEYGKELDFDFHAQELKEKTSKLIKSLQNYQLPDTYTKIAEEQIENQKEEIQNRMKDMISNFVNGGDYPSVYSTFTQAIGEQLGDLLYNMLEEKFKTK